MNEWVNEWVTGQDLRKAEIHDRRDKVGPCTSFLTALHPNLEPLPPSWMSTECKLHTPHPPPLLPSAIPRDTLLSVYHHSLAGLEWFPDFETCPPSEFLGTSAHAFHSAKMLYSTSSSWFFSIGFRPLPACHFLNGCFMKSCKTRSPWNPLSYVESCISL